jgi:hypothetical protein
MDYLHHKKQLGDADFATGSNENGESVVWEHGEHGTIRTTTFQDNGWAVVHIWHDDGRVEELFEKYED